MKKQKYERPANVLSPLKAIRAHCLDCMCGQYNEVRLCPTPECPLYAYRFGRRPREGMQGYTQGGYGEKSEATSRFIAEGEAGDDE